MTNWTVAPDDGGKALAYLLKDHVPKDDLRKLVEKWWEEKTKQEDDYFDVGRYIEATERFFKELDKLLEGE